MQRWLSHLPLNAGDDKFMSYHKAVTHSHVISAHFVVVQSRLAFQNCLAPQLSCCVIFKVLFRVVEHPVTAHPSLQNYCCREQY